MAVPVPPALSPENSPEVRRLSASYAVRFRLGRPGPRGDWTRLALDGRRLTLSASHPALLYALAVRASEDLQAGIRPRTFKRRAGFRWLRPLNDILLNQAWRTARGVDEESHVRELARQGFTHLEVNGLAFSEPIEKGVPGEYYRSFYTYCPALDQFTESSLTRGLYPRRYLSANLARLKRLARLGLQYGLQPGLLCFEPRSLPERFFRKYPTLRGPRVDHPWRSWLPRFSLATSHPAVRAHYAELVRNLMKEVPELSCMTVWTNDSGAGFEHTASLYAGRNGGAFLIREWRNPQAIARAAGLNVVQFLKTIRDAASETNPDFRVAFRLEPFKEEHAAILDGLEDRLDIEAPTLLVRGYSLPYAHPRYPDVKGVAGTVHHLRLDPREKRLLSIHRKRGVEGHFNFSLGTASNFDPLLGIPYPWMLAEKLDALKGAGATHLAALGGGTPPALAPFNPNAEVLRAFRLGEDPEAALGAAARRWAGRDARTLLAAWREAERGIRALPLIPLYSGAGMIWNRGWVRPFLPDLLAPTKAERAPYEPFIVGTFNNTNLTDLGRDILFEVYTPEYGTEFARRVDRNVHPRLDRAIRLAAAAKSPVFVDLADRLVALRCWTETMRNLGAWREAVLKRRRGVMNDLIRREIASTRILLRLWGSSRTEFMAVRAEGEDSFIYGRNFGALLRHKIRLMRKYRAVPFRVDPEIQWRLR